MFPKTAIIGATGFIGKFFLAAHRKIHRDCVGTSKDANSQETSYLDLLSPSIVPLKLAESGHREALIFAGVAEVATCEKEKDLTRKINVDGTLNLIEQLFSEGIKPVFFSTPAVFDGVSGLYDEEDFPHPVNEYARQKAEVETHIKKICNKGGYLIVRLAKTFSVDKGDGTILDQMASILKSGGFIRAAYDQIFSLIYVLDLLEIVSILQVKGVTGVINITPPEAWSRYDLALAIANCMGVSPQHIEKISLTDLHEPFNRPHNTSMKADKMIRETGYQFTPTIQYIERIAENWREEVVAEDRGNKIRATR